MAMTVLSLLMGKSLPAQSDLVWTVACMVALEVCSAGNEAKLGLRSPEWDSWPFSHAPSGTWGLSPRASISLQLVPITVAGVRPQAKGTGKV